MKHRDYALITGGAGFIGSNLADALLADGARVVLLDNFSRSGVEDNVRWLAERHAARLTVERGDVADGERVRRLVDGAAVVYHLAAQVAVTTSLVDPEHDLRTNLLGTFHVLEAARRRDDPPPVVFSSTNKVYGALETVPVELNGRAYRYAGERSGIDETTPLDFHSPYGCSKGAADQYVRDYARIYRLPTVVLRLSCIYGRRQFGTEDQGWVAHFARSALAGRAITIYGDGRQVRDVLFVDDLVRVLRAAARAAHGLAGEIFNIGGGAENAASLREVLTRVAVLTGRRIPVTSAPWRPGDQRIYVSDTSKARRLLGWAPVVPWPRGLEELVAWLRDGEVRRLGPRRFSRPPVGAARVAARAAS